MEKERDDLKHNICKEEMAVGSIFLLHDTQRKKDMSRKLVFKWLGPYQISDTLRDKGTYMLKELDRSQWESKFADNRLKKISPPAATSARLYPGRSR